VTRLFPSQVLQRRRFERRGVLCEAGHQEQGDRCSRTGVRMLELVGQPSVQPGLHPYVSHSFFFVFPICAPLIQLLPTHRIRRLGDGGGLRHAVYGRRYRCVNGCGVFYHTDSLVSIIHTSFLRNIHVWWCVRARNRTHTIVPTFSDLFINQARTLAACPSVPQRRPRLWIPRGTKSVRA
jgi:hypothetical protein